jgi:hypothetical protein
VGTTFARLDVVSAAAPGDERQTQVQSDAVDETDAGYGTRLEGYLELVGRLFVSSSRQRCIHECDVLLSCRAGATECR